jgi:hypothetical protein
MARKKNGAEVQAPAGFDVSVGREQSDGWVVKKEGNTVLGRLLGRYSFRGEDGRERWYYQVKLDGPCEILPYTEEEGEKVDPIVVGKDAVVNIDESAALEALEPKSNDGGVYDVWFSYKAKTKSKSGPGGFWPVHGPKLRVVKAPPKEKIPF